MIEHVYRRASASPVVSRVIVATDDLRIATQVALAELMLTGCTLSSDHHYVFPEDACAGMLDAGFEAALLAELPMLRRFCMGLCKNPTLTEDLVQETATRAWAHRCDGFDGKNLAAWLT